MNAPVLPKAEVLGEGLDRADWLETRQLGIGGSDIAAILEIEGAWGSPLTIWLDKTGQAAPSDETMYTRAGHRLEQPIAEWFSDETGIPTWQPPPITIYRSTEVPIALASPDRLVCSSDEVEGWLEIKNVGQHRTSEWSAGIPEHYVAQCRWQLAVSGLRVCYLAVLIGGQDFRWYSVRKDDDWAAMAFEAAEKFWLLVESGTQPDVDGSEQTKKAINKQYAEVEPTAVEIGDEGALAVATWRDAVEIAKAAKTELTQAENAVKLMLRHNEIGLVDGEPAVTWKSQHREGYTVEASDYRRLAIPRGAR